MEIRSVRIQNFRGFEDETLNFGSHVCLLGANGVGKSTVLAALNIFFPARGQSTGGTKLFAEDFHNDNTKEPIRITVTFSNLSERAKEDLGHYVRHGELVATAEATFNPDSGNAPVQHFGERLVYKKFTPFFKDEKEKAKVEELRERFAEVIEDVDDFPDIGSKPSKPKMIDALRKYEESNPGKCTSEPSSDLFYGATKGKHKLDPFIQWIYLPAVKEASEEAEETGHTALGKLLQRTVRGQVDFDGALNELRQKTRQEFDDLLEKEQPVLADISRRLANRLSTFSHPGASLEVVWLQESEKSVTINEPKATVKAQEIHFKGSLPHFGHGLQRSFLLAILQELALIETTSSEGEEPDETSPRSGPTLIFACEEPELYQHPPQARHLNNVLRDLSKSGNQVFLTTHSPYFVSGEAFEEIRLIRKDATSGKCTGHCADFEAFSLRLAEITGKKRPDRPRAIQAKLHAALQPELSETFFCNKVVFVEGMEDRAYITAALTYQNKWDDIRRTGLHIVPVGGKSRILHMLIIAQILKIPAFVVFDADGDAKGRHRDLHERDNTCLMKAMEIDAEPFPHETLFGENYTIWPTNIGNQVKEDMGGDKWTELENLAKKTFDPGASLVKNPVLIAEVLREAWNREYRPTSLMRSTESLVRFASR